LKKKLFAVATSFDWVEAEGIKIKLIWERLEHTFKKDLRSWDGFFSQRLSAMQET
jgi:hypothetical protein